MKALRPIVRSGGPPLTAPWQRTRRHLVAAVAWMPAAAVAMPLRAVAASAAVPPAVRELDAAALALFDAAETGRWPQARAALDRARQAAAEVGALEAAYTDAGGELHRFYAAKNALGGDLIEARTALAAKDRRWLVSVADRLIARAGELALPFAPRADAVTPRIETLLFLARRMRRALVWEDPVGYREAQRDFESLWKSLRGELATSVDAKRLDALDAALARAARSRTIADARALHDAVLALRADRRTR